MRVELVKGLLPMGVESHIVRGGLLLLYRRSCLNMSAKLLQKCVCGLLFVSLTAPCMFPPRPDPSHILMCAVVVYRHNGIPPYPNLYMSRSYSVSPRVGSA